MRFLSGVIIGVFICTVGFIEVVNIVSKGVRIIEHTIQDQWMQDRGRVRNPQPTEANINDKTV